MGCGVPFELGDNSNVACGDGWEKILRGINENLSFFGGT